MYKTRENCNRNIDLSRQGFSWTNRNHVLRLGHTLRAPSLERNNQ